jgi:hypothetical protein
MRNIILVIVLCIGMGTVSGQTQPKVNPEFKRFVYQKNTSIEKRTYDSIYFDISYPSSNNWVFKYTYKSSENEMIADDEYMESYEFEIPMPKGKNFVIKAKDFEKHKVIFNRSCFCPDAGLRQLYEGEIRGQLVGKNTWLVQFDVMILPRPGRQGEPIKKTFKGYFKPGALLF